MPFCFKPTHRDLRRPCLLTFANSNNVYTLKCSTNYFATARNRIIQRRIIFETFIVPHHQACHYTVQTYYTGDNYRPVITGPPYCVRAPVDREFFNKFAAALLVIRPTGRSIRHTLLSLSLGLAIDDDNREPEELMANVCQPPILPWLTLAHKQVYGYSAC